jgi:predicted O-methyltransferase YrrM
MSFAIRERIMALHGGGAIKRSALSIRGGAHVFERVMAWKGYRTALEIGTYRGVAAAEMAQYCERVVTIDLVEGKLERMGERFDRRAFWDSLDVKNIDLHLVRNDAKKHELVTGLQFDFAFIDGAHDATVRNDFELVKRCGRVLFHDYDKRGIPELDHVYNFVNTLPKEQVQVHDIFALWTAP